MAIIIKSSMQSARERYEAYLRGEYIPPPPMKVELTEEQTEALLDKAAKMFAKMYIADMQKRVI